MRIGLAGRDCNVHDFDALRFVTGREVTSACAVGSNQVASFFDEAGGAWPPRPTHDSFKARFAGAYRDELRAFTAVVEGRRPSQCTVDDALEAFRIAEACQRSRTEGRPVRLEEIETR